MNFRSGTTGSLGTALLSVLLGACASHGVPVAPMRPGTPLVRYEQTRPSMGGLLRISIVAPDGYDAKADAALTRAFDEVDRWEKLLSEWIPESPVSQVNANAGKEPVKVPAEVIAAFQRAVTVSHASKGAFDVTFAGMDKVWDFGPESAHRVPTPAERDAARAKVDWQKIAINQRESTVFLPEAGMKAGFGGLGQGIGADAAALELKKSGFDDFVVDLSGDAFFAGDAGGAAWRAAIQDPRGEHGKTVASFEVRDQAVETSGDYEKFFIADGVRYHHVLDARTGAPSRGLSSVTVVADDVTTADAYGTAIFASGPTDGLALLLARKLQGVLITSPEEGVPSVMMVTRGLKERIDTRGWTGEVVWIGGSS